MSGSDLDLALAQIRNTPRLMQLLLTSVHPDDLAWKPQPSRYSVSEVLAHLHHVDEQCFGLRVRRMIGESEPLLTAYDDNAFLEQDKAFLLDGKARLESYVQTRSKWVLYLEGLTSEQASRTGRHPSLGTISVAQMLHEWAFHDLGHVRQIAEILRARCFYPGIGPFQSMYTVRP